MTMHWGSAHGDPLLETIYEYFFSIFKLVWHFDPIRLHHVPVQAKAAMDVCLSIFLNERDYLPERRRAVVQRVCITFLLNTSNAARKAFYLGHIKDIMTVIEAKKLKV